MNKRIIGLICIVFGLYLIFNSVKSILKLRQSEGRISTAQNKVDSLKKENERLKKKLNEITSTEYIEKIARDKLNLSKKGESVILLPQNILNSQPKKTEKTETKNWEKWYQLFF